MTKQISVRLEDDIYNELKSGGYNKTDLVNSLLRNFFDRGKSSTPIEDTQPKKASLVDEIVHILLESGITQSMWIKQGKEFNDSQVRLVSVKLKERGHLISDKRVIDALKELTWK